MTKKFSLSSNCKSLRAILQLWLLAITLRCGNAARIFTEDDDTDTPTPPPVPPPEAHPPLSFFIHDILGGSAPSERVVAGITASTQINGLPFSKPNNRVFPIKGGVPLVTANNGININNGFVNNNNLPFLGGPNGATVSTVISNNGNNNLVTNGNALLFVTAGLLPQGAALQNPIFGAITVIDDELTEGHELGASVIGKAQGFFGVHRTASHESGIAVVGGTGKYENAEGYATIETLHLTNQHTTDGVEAVLEFTVYLT
ncbi:Dirigent protein 9 [Citrus sinensis]|nr:Dirigent protein 9 [Citrus sinensis]